MSLGRPSVDKLSHDLVRKYTSEPLKFAYYEHLVATPPMRQSRRASVANRVLIILIIAASLFLLYYRSGPRLSQDDRACIQDEWSANTSTPSTQDFGSTYRISFVDTHENITWKHLPNISGTHEILMMIVSNADDFARRNVLRSTWMKAENSRIVAEGRMKALFLVGRGSEKVDKVVMEEAKLFGDMVVTDFEDSYVGLPYKSLSMLLYAVNKSPSTQLIGKIDHDVIFFPDQLDAMLKKGLINTSSSTAYGRLYEAGVAVNRGGEGGKWLIPESSYKCSVYPSYLSGPFYLSTKKAAERILEVTKHRKFLSVEDVLITGLLAGDVGVERVHLPHVYSWASSTSDKQNTEVLAWHTNKNNQQFAEAFENLRKTRCKPCNPKDPEAPKIPKIRIARNARLAQ